MRFSQAVTYGLSIPKTLYFNFRCLKFREALRLPIFISYKVRLLKLNRRVIEIDESDRSPFMVKIGFNGTDEVASRKSSINLESGKLLFKGNCVIAEGCSIGVSNGGTLEFGCGFSANKNFFISCNDHVSFGDDVMIGWNVTFFDANGHPIYKDGVLKDNTKPISIGDHVWIGSESHILKGANIPNSSIIAYGSLVSSKLKEEAAIYGGVPVQTLQNCIEWKRHND